MNMLKLVTLAGAVALSCAGAASAATAAVPAPDAVYGASLGKYADFTSVSHIGQGSWSDGFSAVSVGSQPSPFVRVHADGEPANSDPAVFGGATYYVGVNGPADGVLVPIDVAYKMSGKIILAGGYDAYAQANLTLLSEYRGNRISSVFVTHDGNFDVSGVTAFEVASGTFGQVSLSARAGLVVDVVGTGVADAFVDPVFTIDPVFAAANPGYSLVFSDGAGNSAGGAAPEPATWALMLVGVGATGAALRSRRRLVKA